MPRRLLSHSLDQYGDDYLTSKPFNALSTAASATSNCCIPTRTASLSPALPAFSSFAHASPSPNAPTDRDDDLSLWAMEPVSAISPASNARCKAAAPCRSEGHQPELHQLMS